MYEIPSYARETSDAGVVIQPLPLDLRELLTISYGDSGWANAEEFKSQTGAFACLTTRKALRGTAPASLLSWKSSRSKRVCRSTLASESCAADDTTDHAYYVASVFGELLLDQPATSTPVPGIPVYNVTDCKSLYDAVIKMNPSIGEKRKLIDIQSIKQSLADDGTRWVPTHLQWADAFTKADRVLRQKMTDWMQHPAATLHDCCFLLQDMAT